MGSCTGVGLSVKLRPMHQREPEFSSSVRNRFGMFDGVAFETPRDARSVEGGEIYFPDGYIDHILALTNTLRIYGVILQFTNIKIVIPEFKLTTWRDCLS